jgi:ornithine cyclodeaminase/alanine dehydrogenase-like protein (mu-crystallin family)
MQILSISAAEVERLLDPLAAMDVLAEGFKALSAGRVQVPPRPMVSVPDKGFAMAMLACTPGQLISLKTVNVFHHNHALGLPSHVAVIQLFDPETGVPVAIMDGAVITGLRTAAAAMLTVRELARMDAKVATVIGGGVQGRDHTRLLGLVRPLDEIRVISRTRQSAERAAHGVAGARVVTDVAEAVRSSDIVCLTSSSDRPVIEASWVRPGTHVTSVGFAPPGGELPRELAEQATVYVETRNAFSAPPVGCAELQGLDPQRGIELGELLSGLRPGRTSAEQITVYKSMGNAMEDMVVANLVYQRAKQQGVGRIIDL